MAGSDGKFRASKEDRSSRKGRKEDSTLAPPPQTSAVLHEEDPGADLMGPKMDAREDRLLGQSAPEGELLVTPEVTVVSQPVAPEKLEHKMPEQPEMKAPEQPGPEQPEMKAPEQPQAPEQPGPEQVIESITTPGALAQSVTTSGTLADSAAFSRPLTRSRFDRDWTVTVPPALTKHLTTMAACSLQVPNAHQLVEKAMGGTDVYASITTFSQEISVSAYAVMKKQSDKFVRTPFALSGFVGALGKKIQASDFTNQTLYKVTQTGEHIYFEPTQFPGDDDEFVVAAPVVDLMNVIQAMLCGVPIVCSDWNIMPEPTRQLAAPFIHETMGMLYGVVEDIKQYTTLDVPSYAQNMCMYIARNTCTMQLYRTVETRMDEAILRFLHNKFQMGIKNPMLVKAIDDGKILAIIREKDEVIQAQEDAALQNALTNMYIDQPRQVPTAQPAGVYMYQQNGENHIVATGPNAAANLAQIAAGLQSGSVNVVAAEPPSQSAANMVPMVNPQGCMNIFRRHR